MENLPISDIRSLHFASLHKTCRNGKKKIKMFALCQSPYQVSSKGSNIPGYQPTRKLPAKSFNPPTPQLI